MGDKVDGRVEGLGAKNVSPYPGQSHRGSGARRL